MRTSVKRVRIMMAAGLGAVLAAGPGAGYVLAQTAPAQPAPAATAKTPPAVAAKAPAGGDAALRQRVEQLEEQLVDLQVVIGTLESLARSGASNASAASAASGASAADSARLQSIEQQVRALTAQLEQLSAEVRGGQRPDRRTDAGAVQAPAGPVPSGPVPSGQGGVQFGAPPAAPATAGTNSFSSTTVTSSHDDPIGGLIDNGAASPGVPPKTGVPLPDVTTPAGAAPAPGAMAALPPADGSNPKLAYETAYGNLLRQDYGAAQAGFTDFLRRYPNETLAPDALFWLGETHYVQRNYADAAEAFGLVTSSFASSGKAPEAQLKRAMALNLLGKKDEACAALRQLNSKFPGARAQLKSKADSERQKAGCV